MEKAAKKEAAKLAKLEAKKKAAEKRRKELERKKKEGSFKVRNVDKPGKVLHYQVPKTVDESGDMGVENVKEQQKGEEGDTGSRKFSAVRKASASDIELEDEAAV